MSSKELEDSKNLLDYLAFAFKAGLVTIEGNQPIMSYSEVAISLNNLSDYLER